MIGAASSARPSARWSNGQDRPIGALSVTAPGTVTEQALDHGYSEVRALPLSVAIGKVHGLAVAEEARGRGIASFLLKRAWHAASAEPPWTRPQQPDGGARTPADRPPTEHASSARSPS
ncbi:GNAT family N-acetyltransferase [Streptomyces sp. NPDC087769]|uniref:GNAT family N-acetyltransferase n=1 Tax=Streptomyces sp. NPDC087769 TaxID=3365802 RepID=UPI0038153561